MSVFWFEIVARVVGLHVCNGWKWDASTTNCCPGILFSPSKLHFLSRRRKRGRRRGGRQIMSELRCKKSAFICRLLMQQQQIKCPPRPFTSFWIKFHFCPINLFLLSLLPIFESSYRQRWHKSFVYVKSLPDRQSMIYWIRKTIDLDESFVCPSFSWKFFWSISRSN